MKKQFACVAVLLLAMTSLSGCRQNQKNTNKLDHPNADQTNSFFYKTTDTGLVEGEQSLVDLRIADDKLLVTKTISKRVVDFICYDAESGQSETVSLDYDSFENGLNENFTIAADDTNCYLLSPGEESSVVYTVDLKQKSVSCLDLQTPHVYNFCTDGNGGFLIAYYQYDIRNQYVMLEQYQNGSKAGSVDLSKLLENGNTIDLCDISADGDDNCYVVYTMNNKAYAAKIGPDQKLISKAVLSGILGMDNHIIRSGSGTLFVANRDESGLILLNSIDAETCETKEFFEEKDADNILNGVGDYDYIAVNSAGYHGVKTESGKHELLRESAGYQSAAFAAGHALTSASIGCQYENVLVKAEKGTNNSLSETVLAMDPDCCVTDAAYLNDKFCYLCQNNKKQFLLVTDQDGKTEKTQEFDGTEKGVAQEICADQSGNLYIVSGDNDTFSFRKLDQDFKPQGEIKIDDMKGVKRLVCAGGNVYSNMLDGDTYKLDFAQNKAEKNDLGCFVYDCYAHGDTFMIQDDAGVVYSYQNNALNEVFSCNELSQLNSMGVSEIFFDSTEHFYVWSDIEQKLYEINKVNTADITDSKVLNVAFDIDNASLKRMISGFTFENENVLFKLSDYSTDEKVEKLNTDIASGIVPDIIVSDGRIDLSVFENMGVLEDLTDYFEKDSAISSDDYYMNIFRACSNTGKLNQIVPRFSVVTGFGKSSLLGTELGWNNAEFLEKTAANPDKDIIFNGLFKNNVRYEDILYYNLVDMIDFEHKKFNIDAHYAKVLADMKPYMISEIEDYANYSKNDLSAEFDERFRKDRVLFDIQDIFNVNDICILRDATVNEDIVLKGLPSASSNGSYVRPYFKVAMLTSCKEKDTAWAFIKQYLSDTYQDTTEMDGFPVKKSAVEATFDRCEERKIFVGDTPVDVHVPSQELRSMTRDWLASISKSVCIENRLANIICPELDKYLNAQQNEEQTLKEIKRKIELYLSEV